MGVGSITPDDGKDDEQNGSDKPSVSYIYIYETGREEIENWSDKAQQAMVEAYKQVSGGGTVRNQFKATDKFENVHDATGQFYASLGTAFDHPGYIVPVHQSISEELLPALHESLEEGNLQPLLEWVGPDADDLLEFIDNNPEVAEELADELEAE